MSAVPDQESPLVFDLDSPVRLHALEFLYEGEDVTVGRREIDSYCVLPVDGAALLRELERGVAPRSAAEWYADTYGEPVDIEEFLAGLDELGFTLDGDIASPGFVGSTGSEVGSATHPRVAWQRLGTAVFSRPAWAAYAALLVAAAIAMIAHRDLLPQSHNLFYTRYATAVILLGVVGQFPFVLLHEAFHALAGRRLGLRSSLRVSRRLYFLVAETSLDGLVMVPRRKRYLPILAGMLADLLAIAGLTLIATATRHPDGTQPLGGRICLALAFATMLRFLWQFYLFLQTDLYQLTVTVLGCIDLHRTAGRVIVNRLARLAGRPPRFDESAFYERDRAVARWYSWLLVAGYAFCIASFVLAVVPLLRRLFGDSIHRLVSGHGVSWGEITDSATFLLLSVIQLGVAAYIAARDRRRRLASATTHVIS